MPRLLRVYYEQEDDAFREEYLEQKGYHIIRFTNEEVLYNIENVMETIDNYFNE